MPCNMTGLLLCHSSTVPRSQCKTFHFVSACTCAGFSHAVTARMRLKLPDLSEFIAISAVSVLEPDLTLNSS